MLHKYITYFVQDLEANNYWSTSKFHLTLHHRMWAWLAAHPYSSKQVFADTLDLPARARHIFYSHSCCFACLYATKHCDNCPLLWNNPQSICTDVCDPHGGTIIGQGLYMSWLATPPHDPARTDYALSIALRPVKPGIPCI